MILGTAFSFGRCCTRAPDLAAQSRLENKQAVNRKTPLVQLLKPNTYEEVSDSPEAQSTIPITFEEATITGSHWVFKINAETSTGQPRLVPTALERPSPPRRGTVISAPEKSTSGNEPASIGTPNIDVRDLGRRVDDGKRSTGTDEIKDGAMDHEKGGEDEGDPEEGELRCGQRRDETSPSTPKVRRSVGVKPCRAPNALKSYLKLFCQCCAGCPGPGSSPPSSLSANNSRFGTRLEGPCEQKPSLAKCSFHALAPGFLEGFGSRFS